MAARPVGQLQLRVKNISIRWWMSRMSRMRLTESLERGVPAPSKIGGRICSLHLNQRVTWTVRIDVAYLCRQHCSSNRLRSVGTFWNSNSLRFVACTPSRWGRSPRRGGNHALAWSLNIYPSYSRLNVTSISSFLNTMRTHLLR